MVSDNSVAVQLVPRLNSTRPVAQPSVRDSRPPDSRTRARCLFIVRYEKSSRTGASRETVVSNSTFDGAVFPPATSSRSTCSRMGNKTGDWLARLDSNLAAFSRPQSATTSSSVGSNWRCFGRVSRRGAVTGRRPARIGYVSSRRVQEVRQAHLGRVRTPRRGSASGRAARGSVPVPAQVAAAAPARPLIVARI